MTLQFLDMVHYDTGGRLFTYVITLDGMFRFTETGKEFGIDLLSKHTMHSDVQVSLTAVGCRVTSNLISDLYRLEWRIPCQTTGQSGRKG